MKRLLFFIIAIAGYSPVLWSQTWINFSSSIPGAPEMNVLTSNSQAVTFEVTIPGIYTMDTIVGGAAFTRLALPNGGAVNSAGHPEIPVLTYRVAIPTCSAVEIEYRVISQQTMPPCLVYPVPRMAIEQDTDGNEVLVEQFAFDSVAYAQPLMNGQAAIVSSSGKLRSQDYVEVMVQPVEFCPVTQQLSVIDKIEITLHFINPQGVIQQNVGIFNKAAASAFINYKDNGISALVNDKAFERKNFTPGNVQYITLTDTAQAATIVADYLIICAGQFFTSFSAPPAPHPQIIRLAEHRTCYNGFTVAVVNVENILALGFYHESSNPDYIKEQKMRTFIRRVYEGKNAPHLAGDGHLAYVLLIGDNYVDNNGMPTATEHGISFSGEVYRSDYYFSCITRNAIGKYDDIGDLFIGRFSVEDNTQLFNMVQKTIYHETEYSPKPWRKTAGTTLGNLDNEISTRYCNFMNNLFNDCGWDYSIVDAVALNGAIKIPTINYFNTGASFVQYIGAPDPGIPPTSWMDGLTIPYFSNELHNDYMVPFISTVSSNSGHIDNMECLGEFLTRYDPIKGAVGYIGASRRVPLQAEPWPPGSEYLLYQEALPHHLFIGSITIAGELLLTTKLTAPFQSIQQRKYAYNLLGDPALNILATGYEITQNLTLDSPSTLSNTLYIRNGGTLTILSTLNCAENVSIIVEPGGKLIVDGGTITAANADSVWKGIVVLGNPAKPQDSRDQGMIELKNGTVIEHAVCAISAGSAKSSCVSSFGAGNFGGGIIKANNTTFRNNLLSVEYLPYEAPAMMGIFVDNVGKFTNCNFIYHPDTRFEFTRQVYNAKLWGVRNVTFEGCFFENIQLPLAYANGYGIYSLDAGVKVKNYCSVKQSSQYIDCACPLAYSTPSIFKGFIIGIQSENTGSWYQIYVDQSKFQNNNNGIWMNSQTNYRVTRCDFINNAYHALLSFNSSGYRIEENDFTFSAYHFSTIGILIGNSGIAENLIYKNNFNNFGIGISSGGINGSSNFPPQGLQFVCNNFTNNRYDIFMSEGGTHRPLQGSSLSGANNTFVGTQYRSIYSGGSNPQQITYYHSPGNNHAPYNPTSNVSVIGNAASNSCASTFCLPVGRSKDGSIEQYKAMQQQYDQLLAQLEKNPELLHEILVLSSAMHSLSDHAISSILEDSILYVEVLKQWYEVVRTPIAKYCLAEGYFNESNYEQAETILKEMSKLFAFNEQELLEHENYMRFYNFKKQMQLSGRNWEQLDKTEIAYLKTIAEATNGRSASMAGGVLCFFYEICEELIIEKGEEILPPKNATEETQIAGIQEQNQAYELFLYPNPAESEMTVNLNNPDVKIVQMEIYDLFGKRVHQQTVNQPYGTLKLNELVKGVYILKVHLNQGDMVIRKVVKQ